MYFCDHIHVREFINLSGAVLKIIQIIVQQVVMKILKSLLNQFYAFSVHSQYHLRFILVCKGVRKNEE